MNAKRTCASLLVLAVLLGATYADNKQQKSSAPMIFAKRAPYDYSFNLVDAYFTTRLIEKDDAIIARRDDKLVVLKYKIINNQPHGLNMGPRAANLTLVKGKGRYAAGLSPMWFEKNDREVRPGEGVESTVAIEVPADLEDPELLVQLSGGSEFKYDLEGQIRPMQGKFAGPGGKTASNECKVAVGESAEFGSFDIKVLGSQDIPDSPDYSLDLQPGEHLVGVTVELKNICMHDTLISQASFYPEFPQDQHAVSYIRWLVTPGKLRDNAEATLKPKGTFKGILLFRVAAGQRIGTIKLRDTSVSERTVVVSL